MSLPVIKPAISKGCFAKNHTDFANKLIYSLWLDNDSCPFTDEMSSDYACVWSRDGKILIITTNKKTASSPNESFLDTSILVPLQAIKMGKDVVNDLTCVTLNHMPPESCLENKERHSKRIPHYDLLRFLPDTYCGSASICNTLYATANRNGVSVWYTSVKSASLVAHFKFKFDNLVTSDNESSICAVAVSSEAYEVAAADSSGSIFFWNLKQPYYIQDIRHTGYKPVHLAYSPNGQHIVMLHKEGLLMWARSATTMLTLKEACLRVIRTRIDHTIVDQHLPRKLQLEIAYINAKTCTDSSTDRDRECEIFV